MRNLTVRKMTDNGMISHGMCKKASRKALEERDTEFSKILCNPRNVHTTTLLFLSYPVGFADACHQKQKIIKCRVPGSVREDAQIVGSLT